MLIVFLLYMSLYISQICVSARFCGSCLLFAVTSFKHHQVIDYISVYYEIVHKFQERNEVFMCISYAENMF